jgi:hypothetical protein
MKGPVRGYGCFLVVVFVGLLAGGCSGPAPERVVGNPDPLGKIPAFKAAVRGKDRKAARQMVRDLGSDDPAVRLFAIGGLERLTGETLGYRYYDNEHERHLAIKRWEGWLSGKKEDVAAPQQDAALDQGGAPDAPNKASGP